jgi:hypothetical protein
MKCLHFIERHDRVEVVLVQVHMPRFLDEPPLRGSIRKCSFTMPAAAIKRLVSPSDSSSDGDMSTLSKYALVAALRLLLPIYKDNGNHGQCPRQCQLCRKLRRPTNIP